jgi:Na+-driven multidrug efflux pump
MNRIKPIGFTIALAILTTFCNAQAVAEKQPDFMRSNGKIYVVMAVVVTILIGLFLYLINLDRKISKLEKGK